MEVASLFRLCSDFFICAISIYKLSLFGRFKDWREYAVQFLAIGLVGSYATVANAAENSYTDQDSFAATAIQHSVGSSQDFATSEVEIDTGLFKSESEISTYSEENFVVAQAGVPNYKTA